MLYDVRLVAIGGNVDSISFMPPYMNVINSEKCLKFTEDSLPILKSQYGPPDETGAPNAADIAGTPLYAWNFKDGGQILLSAAWTLDQKCEAHIFYNQPSRPPAQSTF